MIRKMYALIFEDILKIDIANQKKGYVSRVQNQETAEEVLNIFRKDPAAWVNSHLIVQLNNTYQ